MDVWGWFADSASWQGDDGIWHRLAEHSLLTLTALLLAAVVGLPLALWLGHTGRGGLVLVNLTNVGRAIPVIALLSLLSLGFVGSATLGPYGRAGLATLLTLTAFALPPIVTITTEAVRGVDAQLVEAARGMGMSGWQLLTRVEIPNALPLIISGLRLALVQVWATATIAALVAGPGLGRIIVHGYDSDNGAEVIGAATIVAAVALVLEGGMTLLQRAVTRPG
ncbi:MAG TPA: ABC transporter permease [Marmoricola sp.]|nr:ABC transporter permease [Marmoricola sp.]HNI69763.1 ABC transporter permease [Marmoricola sp.]HNO39467.1 ABC transporter permease [Marmoricola sp.]